MRDDATALEEDLDELRHVLPEIRMQAVNVLRSLSLRQFRLRPRKLEVYLLVERRLSPSCHRMVDSKETTGLRPYNR